MSLTRRDVLAAFLGVPLAASACSAKKRVPDGELAMKPDELGHRVRDEAPPALSGEKWRDVGTVIVGGGVAGLSAAWRLREKGDEDFVLVELDSAVGGTARSGSNATSRYPWGAHYITAPMKQNKDLITLLRDFGTVEGEDARGEPIFREEVLCREPQERVFAGGTWSDGIYPSGGEDEADQTALARFKKRMEEWAERRDARGRRAFSLPIALGSDDDELRALDALTMTEWMKREGFGDRRLAWLVDYACRDDFCSRASDTSAWAGIHYYASRLRGSGSEAQSILTWPEGNGWLVGKLHERVRAKTRTGLAVIDIAPTDSGVDVIAIGRAPEAVGFHAKRVIFAAPQMVARRVVRPWRDAPPPHLEAFEYGAWMVANLTLSRRPKGRGVLAWDNVLYDSPGLGYVTATHQTGRDHGPTVITYFYPLTDDPKIARRKLYAAGRDEWADVALADLERAHPDIREVTTRLDVVRWGHAMPRPKKGFFFGGAREAARRPFRGIHFAHTDLSGVALFEEAFYHGVRAADEIRGAPI